MLKETGKVISIDADGLWVETLNASACGQCRARAGCGQKLLAGYGQSSSSIKALFTSLPQTHIWQVGDSVEIGIDESTLVKSAMLAYILPLLFMVLGVILAHHFFQTEFASVLGAASGLIVGGGCIAQVLKKNKACSVQGEHQFHAVVLSVIH